MANQKMTIVINIPANADVELHLGGLDAAKVETVKAATTKKAAKPKAKNTRAKKNTYDPTRW